MNDLYELIERADEYFNRYENIPKDIVKQICKLTMGQGYIGLAQINPDCGDIESNSKKIVRYINYASSIGLDLIVFPELSLVGSPLGDTFEKFPFLIEENLKWLDGIAKKTKDITVLLGFLEPLRNDCIPSQYYSSIAVIKNGKIIDIIRKSNNSKKCNIFDYKYIASAKKGNTASENNDCVILLGDDCLNTNRIDSKNKCCIINPSIFPNFLEFDKIQMLSNISKKTSLPVIHVNRVGATDTVSFEGYSSMYDANGELVAQAKAFEEQLLVVNPEKSIGKIYSAEINESKKDKFSLEYEYDLDRVYKTIIQGIKDYFSKCGLKRAVLGLSGGLDSSVCAVLLADALGPQNVLGVSMPSNITTDTSKSDAEKLASNLGINFAVCPIKEIVETTSQALESLFSRIEKHWAFRCKESYTRDNIQARSRATYLWAISNEFSCCIPIATSDKSEAYMGYATINGDMSGGLAPIADITKTKLFALARWMNKNRQEKNVIPQSIIDKKPGAELAINPKTGKPLEAEEALMPYEFLDEVIWRVENKQESIKDMLNSKFHYEMYNKVSLAQKEEWLNKFFRRMSSSLYKWSIMPPSIRVEKYSINKSVYHQPIVSGKINYNKVSEDYINSVLAKI